MNSGDAGDPIPTDGATAPPKRPYRRIGIDATDQMVAVLVELEALSGARTSTETVRRALGLAIGLWRLQAKGGKLIYRDDEGRETDVLALF